MIPELGTERLLLRPFRGSDLPAIAAYAHDERYRRHLGPDHPVVEDFVAHNVAVDGTREFAWVVLERDQLVGSVFLGVKPDDASAAELACLLDPRHWGRGIGTEAARAVLAFGFDELRLDEIFAAAAAGNVASIRGMERLGLRPDADGSVFRIRHDEWKS